MLGELQMQDSRPSVIPIRHWLDEEAVATAPSLSSNACRQRNVGSNAARLMAWSAFECCRQPAAQQVREHDGGSDDAPET
jgi:hypothetical protein